ncbi:MAG: acetylornithine deacetylase [Rhizobiales bacterium]|nr:acetylornithine deacetylase [Hyphomicrobiales bacterium]
MSATQKSAKELLERLIGFDTTSDKSNLALVDFVRSYLSELGVECTVLADETSEKAALYATIGPNQEGGVVLSAHSDVVPTEGQPWSSNPYQMRSDGGRLYGRGSTDMKGFLATVLAEVPAFVAAGLKRPVHIALSYDEEVGCLGVRPLSQHMKTRVALPEAVIVGEPTGLAPVNAHKSAYRLETEIHGRSAHSSVPSWGVNAVFYAAHLVTEIERLGERLAAQKVSDPRFEPPYPTVSVGEISGGTAHNIVPDHCRVVWGMRGMPDTDVPALVEEIRAYCDTQLVAKMRVVDEACVINTQIAASILPLKPRGGSSAEALISTLTGIAEMGAVSYGTDAGFFDDIGWPSVVCGPGDIAQAHKPDEFIAEDALDQCTAMLGRLGAHLSA